jgi:hypothetical protein
MPSGKCETMVTTRMVLCSLPSRQSSEEQMMMLGAFTSGAPNVFSGGQRPSRDQAPGRPTDG